MDTLWQDLRHVWRIAWHSPAFFLPAVAALALGIGANTAIFSVVNTVLLRPLPYPDPGRLVTFLNTAPQGSAPGASPTKFNTWRRQTAAFQDVSAYRVSVVNLTEGNPEQIATAHVSADFFRLFGAPMQVGRTFTGDEDRPGGGRVVVLSEGFWKRRFGGDSSAVGRTMSLNGEPHEVIGVLGRFDAEAVQGPTGPPDVFLPFQIDPNSTMQGHFFMSAGRLKPGVTIAAANAQLQQAAGEFRGAYPNAMGAQGGFGVEPMQEIVVRNVRSSLWVLLGAVTFVLLIACANVANLLLVRAGVRKRELAIRAAIGAGRGRIIRQLLTESVILSMLGGALGLVLGMVGIRALLAINPGNIPRIGLDGSGVRLDWRVLLFTVVVSLATGLLFGLFPALTASRTDLNTTLKESSGRSASGFRQNKVRALLVVSEMGLALVLLIGAALFIRTFIALRAVDPGFDAAHVLTMRMSLRGDPFANTAAVAQLMRDGSERLRALPGVEVAGAACCVPLQGGFGLPIIIEGRPLEGPSHGGGGFAPISPSYFNVFKIPIVKGRAFTDQDSGAGARRRHHQSGDGETAVADRRPDWRPDHHRARTRSRHGVGRPADRRHRRRRAGRRPQSRSATDHVRALGADAGCAQRQSARYHAAVLDCPHAWRALCDESTHPRRTAAGQRRAAGGDSVVDAGRGRTVDGPLRFQHVGADDLRRRPRWCWRRSASTA